MEQNTRLIDLVSHLPADSKLSTTGEFERVIGHKLEDVSILQACGAIMDSGYDDNDAVLQDDTINIYTSEKETSWPAFTLFKEKESKGNESITYDPAVTDEELIYDDEDE